ncbi:FecCD family ABC transporter permease [Paenibacillus sacheonensis]|uniref:Iron chelate uptake ABC transporter family permease subunit n=1 Tax=Paenibacillus sacheonensis TaxID=742054 RepID=A0A7X4YKJ6_9BACL|nr:iron ABC transporter permease [Paenibacillus sacheonensis]MBM7563453.1 iron complex transport system permease protein [Paenibacillus sacheonensis]NBC67992.1 iron chelate uptake ABC transporter family permease subunit [Paenibacillus sacheonensis]
MKSTAFSHAERSRGIRAARIMGIMLLLVVVLFMISMNTGVIRLAPLDVLRTLSGSGSDNQELILFQFRLPRIVMSLLIGAGFGLSGCMLQGITRNALAEPGILGINAGAGLVVLLYVSSHAVNGSVFLLPVLSLLGAGAAAALIYGLSYRRHQGVSTIRMLLVGIAIAAGINALTLVLTLKLNPEQFTYVQTWLAGSIMGTDWRFVTALLPWLVVLLPVAFAKARILDVMNLGDFTATGLGSAVQRERLYLFAAAVGLAASCTALGGSIGFVGLIGPHLARRLVGPQHRQLLPASALAGALLVMAADTIARPFDVPTGIVVAVIGAPYFLYLLAKSRN